MSVALQQPSGEVPVVRRGILLTGCVQGIGIRPKIVRLAQRLGLAGRVRNSMSGVVIDLQGPPTRLNEFFQTLHQQLPGNPHVAWRNQRPVAEDCHDFCIVESEVDLSVQTIVPVDRMVCRDCLAETRQRGNRRFGYAFTSCVECGPRYTILKAMPYDRQRTAMSQFEMCPQCESEYRDPADRRFHSQTNCCPQCGPRLWSTPGNLEHSGEALDASIQSLRSGQILAVKGLGGYQLVCDATDEEAVARLRSRKGRRSKPLAVMVDSIEQASQLASLTSLEQDTLQDPAGAIVLVGARRSNPLAPSIHPGLRDVGLMLPTSPLHALLIDAVGRPLVVTSGNRESDPLEYEQAAAETRLAAIADRFLHHDRPILRPIDDSVVRCTANGVVTIRAGRGLAPMSFDRCPSRSQTHCLAVGGQQKVAVAITTDRHVVLGPHLGDLESVAMRDRFTHHVAAMSQLLGVQCDRVVHDAHPDYHSTRWAQTSGRKSDSVQHHHAHIVAGMFEHGWLDREVLGFAMDGTGLGSDGTIWGGEVLLATATEFRRVGHLRPFPLVGGDKVVKQPWRVAVAMLVDTFGRGADDWIAHLIPDGIDPDTFLRLVGRETHPTSSSVGRLFDAVAAMILNRCTANHEAEGAMCLEAACDLAATDRYPMPISGEKIFQIDWRPMIRQLRRDQLQGQPAGDMAIRFHRGLASAVKEIAERFPNHPIVFSGGVFQNRVLVDLIAQRLRDRRGTIGFSGRVPPGDGGLAVGQSIVAMKSTKE